MKKDIFRRLASPTPKFFNTISKVGLALSAVGGVLLAAPVALPAGFVAVGGYLLTAGAVATAVSQAVTTSDNE